MCCEKHPKHLGISPIVLRIFAVAIVTLVVGAVGFTLPGACSILQQQPIRLAGAAKPGTKQPDPRRGWRTVRRIRPDRGAQEEGYGRGASSTAQAEGRQQPGILAARGCPAGDRQRSRHPEGRTPDRLAGGCRQRALQDLGGRRSAANPERDGEQGPHHRGAAGGVRGHQLPVYVRRLERVLRVCLKSAAPGLGRRG